MSFFVLEPGMCSLQDLLEYRRKNPIKWTEDEVLHLIQCMAKVLCYLKQLGIVHRDIKPDNIIITGEEGIWKLTDFGLSLILQSGDKLVKREEVGTNGFMAPEILSTSGSTMINPFLSDVYSLGITITQVLVDTSEPVVMDIVMDQCSLNSNLQMLIKNMVEIEPEKRIDLDTLASKLEQSIISPEDLLTILEKVQRDAIFSRDRKLRIDTESENASNTQIKIGIEYSHEVGIDKGFNILEYMNQGLDK